MYAVQFKGEDFEIATATTTEEIRQLARAFKTKIKAPGIAMRTGTSTSSFGQRKSPLTVSLWSLIQTKTILKES
jgi:hypothetical protein